MNIKITNILKLRKNDILLTKGVMVRVGKE